MSGSRARTAAAGVLLAASLAACSSGPAADSQTGFAGGDGTFTTIAPGKRVQAPVLSGTTLDGKQLTTADHRGKVLVINVWGSWCSPCRHEAPALEKAAKATATTAQFVGIDTRDLDAAPAKAFVRTFGISYPSLYDPDGALLLKLSALPPKAIPSTLVIDAQGRIAARILGEADASTLTALIGDVAAGK